MTRKEIINITDIIKKIKDYEAENGKPPLSIRINPETYKDIVKELDGLLLYRTKANGISEFPQIIGVPIKIYQDQPENTILFGE